MKKISISVLMFLILSLILSYAQIPYISDGGTFVKPFKAKAATTYYVATTGSDAGTGAIGDPWKTITKAANIELSSTALTT